MLNDPEINKLIIYALAGICAVLFIAVLFLAIKRNTYYIDADGDEVIPPNAKVKKVGGTKKKPVILEDTEDEDDDEEEEVPAPVARPAMAVEETVVQPAAELPSFDEEEEEEQEEPEVMPVRSLGTPVGLAVAVKVGGTVTEHVVDEFPCLIGREATTCDLTITEPAVSRRHARFVKDGNSFYIEDVSEHNGTYLNGSKLAPLGSAKLSEGDRINLGRAEIRIVRFTY